MDEMIKDNLDKMN